MKGSAKKYPKAEILKISCLTSNGDVIMLGEKLTMAVGFLPDLAKVSEISADIIIG